MLFQGWLENINDFNPWWGQCTQSMPYRGLWLGQSWALQLIPTVSFPAFP